MRIVIDMQGAQTQSRFRGIGRYTLGLSKAIARNRGQHDVFLALNGKLTESIEYIRSEFEGLLPQENLRLWYSPTPMSWSSPKSEKNRKIAQIVHAHFIESFAPDAFLFSSLFEGFSDDFACDIQNFQHMKNTSSIIYDFIPLKDPETYLIDPSYRSWYQSRYDNLKKINTLFAISDFVGQEARKYFPDKNIITISSDADAFFSIPEDLASAQKSIRDKWGLTKNFILYAGGVEARKNVHSVIEAFAKLPDTLRKKHQLAIVCGAQAHTHEQLRSIAESKALSQEDVHLIGYIPNSDLRDLYSQCKLFVFPSFEEGFGLPILEAMRCGAPVIASNRSSLPEVVGLEEALFDPADTDAFAQKINQALSNAAFLRRLRRHSGHQQQKFSWDRAARLCISAFEKSAVSPPCSKRSHEERLSSACFEIIHGTESSGTSDSNKVRLAQCLARTFEDPQTPRQLFIDISELSRVDSGTGIQRVTRSILAYLLAHPPQGYSVRPVYATPEEQGYRYAHAYLKQKFDFDDGLVRDDFIEYSHQDFFLGLDLQSSIVPQQKYVLERLHHHGVRVYFFVHDLIPIYFPQYVHQGNEIVHLRWLETISKFDGVVCNSKSTAEEYSLWLSNRGSQCQRPHDIQWIHLGSDIRNSVPTQGMPKDAPVTLGTIRSRPTMLMVSTIEPRKGYGQALDAFELLWKKNVDVNLVIVGREGWDVRKIINRLKKHPKKNKYLFWLKGISDEYLEAVYEASTAILMASEAEGFGLAIVEGARHGKPLLLRDLPVFREIAAEHALYFSGLSGEDLAAAVEKWLTLNAQGRVPTSKGIRCLTWNESAQMLIDKLPLKNS